MAGESAWPLTWYLRETPTRCDIALPPGAVNRFLEVAARSTQAWALDRAAVILNSTEDYARETPLLAERIERFRGILPPVPPPPPAASRDELRTRRGLPDGPVALFVGRFAAEKGLGHLLEAFRRVRARFPSATLLLVGEDKAVPGEAVWRTLEPLLDDRGSGVLTTGFVPDEEIPSLYALSDVLVLLSTNSTESLGMVRLEAMLAGLPVVASDLPGVRMPVRLTGMGELAPAGDPEGLARRIVQVLETPGRYRRDPAQVRKIFSAEQTYADYERAYRAALAEKP